MGDTPAEWAIKPALDELDVGGQPVCHVVKAFARYIETHEEPPVDPLLIEAREVWAKARDKSGESEIARAYRDGSYDNNDRVILVLAALRRGMELAARTGDTK